MPTNLYTQLSRKQAGFLYFRYIIDEKFHTDHDLINKNKIVFVVNAIVTLKDGSEETILLGDPIDSTHEICRKQVGCQPNLHPDQVFFTTNQLSIKNKMGEIRENIQQKIYRGIARVEIHSSLIPCSAENKGCAIFLQKNLMKILDPLNIGDIPVRDIWCITYRDAIPQNSAITPIPATKETALSISARRLMAMLSDKKQCPETGTIRCIQSKIFYPCKQHKIITDNISTGSDYSNMVEYIATIKNKPSSLTITPKPILDLYKPKIYRFTKGKDSPTPKSDHPKSGLIRV